MSRLWSPVRGCRRRVQGRFSPGEGHACVWGDLAGVMLPYAVQRSRPNNGGSQGQVCRFGGGLGAIAS